LTFTLEVNAIYKTLKSHLKILDESRVTKSKFYNKVLKYTKYGTHIKIP